MFVIGIDSHKDTLAAGLVDHLGTPLEYRNISNTPAGHRQLVDWAQTQNAARVAIEGSGTYGRPLGVAAVTAGLDVREVPQALPHRPSSRTGVCDQPPTQPGARRARPMSRHRARSALLQPRLVSVQNSKRRMDPPPAPTLSPSPTLEKQAYPPYSSKRKADTKTPAPSPDTPSQVSKL